MLEKSNYECFFIRKWGLFCDDFFGRECSRKKIDKKLNYTHRTTNYRPTTTDPNS